ncbi:MAG: class I SAM-dependent methyltransferase [Gemmatimonadota bacterium]
MSDADEYDRQYQVWLSSRGADALDLDRRLENLLWRQRAMLRARRPAGLTALDFGCMDGVFTFALERAGAVATGFDVSPAAIQQALRFRGDRLTPRFTTNPPSSEFFDLVYCAEVLEHIDDDRAFVGRLVCQLVPGGVLIGTTPVGRHFWDPDHKRAYDENSLRAVLEPWGSVKLRRYYRSPLRNLLPLKQRGAAVFLFEVHRAG